MRVFIYVLPRKRARGWILEYIKWWQRFLNIKRIQEKGGKVSGKVDSYWPGLIKCWSKLEWPNDLLLFLFLNVWIEVLHLFILKWQRTYKTKTCFQILSFAYCVSSHQYILCNLTFSFNKLVLHHGAVHKRMAKNGAVDPKASISFPCLQELW